MIKVYFSILVSLSLLSCNINSAQEKQNKNKVVKTDSEWKKELSSLEYFVLREKGTERAFSGKYDKHYKKGIYYCKACDTPLFKSENKFNSGTGWPSFDSSIQSNVGYDTDYDLGISRKEIHCNTCDGHLGHVFNDGPVETTGKRYCVNSVSLKFKEKKNPN